MKAISLLLAIVTYSCFISTSFASQTCISSQIHLDKMLKEDGNLQLKLMDALDSRPSTSYWYKKKNKDFIIFFKDWQCYVPHPDTLSKYNIIMADFVETKEGYYFMSIPFVRSWFISFLNERKAFLNSPESAANIQEFIDDTKTKINEFIVPKSGFMNFNSFFQRKLKKNARVVSMANNEKCLNSPVDGTFNKEDSILPNFLNTQVKLKTDTLSTKEVFNNSPYASKFVGGNVLNITLNYYNAHWLYSPVNGKIVDQNILAGLYNLESSNQDLPQHKRGYLIVNTEKFGYVGIVAVGLQTVSEVNFLSSINDDVKKGDVLGHFGYGGSTVIVFFESNLQMDFKIDLNKSGTSLEIGQILSCISK
ncbi:hypothetical protein D5R81_14715 [Parashewanella spongiae]|uniref:Phosphatidylserine decarboxylase n=1 Tax=Parashewanella spongiae TaxID=342950 RepID=A0A3A6TGM9_9GAMM|nr:phosphatidylserine decarboxylase [Parashewanella spongiae]MCL1079218.1 phosphatidylserine decarboxylase [Parashewanella spongiae]RJY10438.1 hypothetical protein D5R81_14715 [Parashewanella spongiae]